MAHHHHAHLHQLHHAQRNVVEEVYQVIQPIEHPDAVPAPSSVMHIEARADVLVPRQTQRCPEGDTSNECEKPQGSNTLPIALASSLHYLHRRHKKKVALEDLNDRHKSLDFGMEGGPTMVNGKKGKGKGGMNMTINPEKSMHGKGRGMSMDMGSPYLLPAGLHSSRESFHSLSRSVKDNHDPYGQVGYASNDDRYGGRVIKDSASIFTESSRTTDRANANLIRNASPMARGYPSRGDSMVTGTPISTTQPEIQFPESAHKPDAAMSGFNFSNGSSTNLAELDGQPDVQPKAMTPPNASATGPGSLPLDRKLPPPPPPPENPFTPELVVKRKTPPAITGLPIDPRTARLQSMEASVVTAGNTTSIASATSDYGDHFKVTPPSPTEPTIAAPKPIRHSLVAPIPRIEEPGTAAVPTAQQPTGLGVEGLDVGNKRYSMSIRPLPVEDPSENPEERANRIRSFYREYFDESKPDPVGQYGEYYEDYGQEYLDGTIYDPATNRFVVAGAPFAQPVTRRAMTPPPRAPPRFGPKGQGHSLSGSSPRFPSRGQTAMSARGAKPMPPPADLKSLPTPHMLKDDSNLFTAMDFAPPVSYRDRQAGRRPDSPMGMNRPYSPAVKAHVPLESSFDDLAAVPSPHLLRKSGTFTALDFAPPRRFKDSDTGSDAGSIRSNRSGISAVQLQSIRAGAYRVSRIPKEVAGTRDDIALALKPTMNLVRPA